MDQHFANREARLEQETQSQLSNAEAQYQNQLMQIERMGLSEDEENARKEQAKLDYENKIKTIDENSAKEKRKIARQKAISERAQASLSVIVNTASAIMQAVAISPLTGGMPWAGIIGALGAVQLGTILSAPLPALAQGGLAFGESLALVGDNRNARMDPEVIAPLSKLEQMMGGGSMEVYGIIRGEDIYLSNMRTNKRLNRIS